jgi:hypothetical protein
VSELLGQVFRDRGSPRLSTTDHVPLDIVAQVEEPVLEIKRRFWKLALATQMLDGVRANPVAGGSEKPRICPTSGGHETQY